MKSSGWGCFVWYCPAKEGLLLCCMVGSGWDWGIEVGWIVVYGGGERLGELDGMDWCWLVEDCFPSIGLRV